MIGRLGRPGEEQQEPACSWWCVWSAPAAVVRVPPTLGRGCVCINTMSLMGYAVAVVVQGQVFMLMCATRRFLTQ